MSSRKSSSKPGGPYRKPQADIYTVMLVLALVAIIVGIVCLYLEMEAYHFKLKAAAGEVVPRLNNGRQLIAGENTSIYSTNRDQWSRLYTALEADT